VVEAVNCVWMVSSPTGDDRRSERARQADVLKKKLFLLSKTTEGATRFRGQASYTGTPPSEDAEFMGECLLAHRKGMLIRKNARAGRRGQPNHRGD